MTVSMVLSQMAMVQLVMEYRLLTVTRLGTVPILEFLAIFTNMIHSIQLKSRWNTFKNSVLYFHLDSLYFSFFAWGLFFRKNYSHYYYVLHHQGLGKKGAPVFSGKQNNSLSGNAREEVNGFVAKSGGTGFFLPRFTNSSKGPRENTGGTGVFLNQIWITNAKKKKSELQIRFIITSCLLYVLEVDMFLNLNYNCISLCFTLFLSWSNPLVILGCVAFQT